jgi:chromosome segregation ATPase
VDALQFWVAALSAGGVFATISTGIFAVIAKRVRGPEVRLAEAQFSVKVYQDQLTEARADKELNEQTIRTLRDYIEKIEVVGREDQELIRSLYSQIHAIEARNDEKDSKIRQLQGLIDRVAEKVSRGEPITLADLGRSSLPADLEDTITP